MILFFHANAEDLGMSFAVLRHMRDQFKVNVLAVEYPGYGLLKGLAASESGIYEVALTAFRYLVDAIGVRYSQIILFGRSLGSGPAVYLAAQYPVGGLILVSAFSSIRAAVQSIVGRVAAWSFRERFPNSRIIANVSCSTLFIHGEADGLIPAEHSLRLFRKCRARKLLITPPRMDHNSNLFGDASFLAVPAIHFFGFPGYYTASPPRLPAKIFESPEKNKEAPPKFKCESSSVKLLLCDCLAKNEQHSLDVTLCRTEMSVEDITIRFFNTGEGPGNTDKPESSAASLGGSDAVAKNNAKGLASLPAEELVEPANSSSERRWVTARLDKAVETNEETQSRASGTQGASKVTTGPKQPSAQDSPSSEEEDDDFEQEEQVAQDLDEIAAATLHARGWEGPKTAAPAKAASEPEEDVLASTRVAAERTPSDVVRRAEEIENAL